MNILKPHQIKIKRNPQRNDQKCYLAVTHFSFMFHAIFGITFAAVVKGPGLPLEPDRIDKVWPENLQLRSRLDPASLHVRGCFTCGRIVYTFTQSANFKKRGH